MASAEPARWQCPVCAEENRRDVNCWACGRPKPRIDWPRRMRQIGAIAVGIALQIAAGVLIWLFPPGVSKWSWAVYLGMGIVGFLHIFIGGEMLRRDLRTGSRESADTAGDNPEPVFTSASLRFEDHRCPRCDASVSRAIERGLRRCPSCRSAFSMRELGWMHADPAGEPTVLPSHEMRISGAVLVASLVGVAAGAMIALLALSGVLP